MKLKKILLILALLLCVTFIACDEADDATTHHHNWSETSILREATCSREGMRELKCECGAKERQRIDRIAHTEVIEVAVSPTCTATGLTEGKHCAVCNEVIVKQEKVQANGHTYGAWTETLAPTCTEKGSERRDCNVCDQFEVREVDANGHTYNKTVIQNGRPADGTIIENRVEPTCTERGSYDIVSYCAICNIEVMRVTSSINKLGHNYSTEWTIDIEPTCTEKGSAHRDCDNCDHFETKDINATGHTYKAIVTPPTVKDQGYTTHTCSTCPDSYVDTYVPATGSIGLAYEINPDGKTCTITGMGICTDTEIYIPTLIDGYKVTAIGDKAFADCTTVTFIKISETVTTIGKRAFYGCAGITEIRIPSNVTYIGVQIFLGCENLKILYYDSSYAPPEGGTFVKNEGLKKIVFGDNLTTIPNYICYNCDNLEEIILSKNTKYIGNYAFYYCTSVKKIDLPIGLIDTGWYAFYEMNITEIIIPDSVESIYNSFRGCRKLEKIVLPVNVISAPSQTFYLCSSLKEVYYTGNELDWSAISISEDSSILREVTVYFYSDSQPTKSGNYWHYVDGVPTIWHKHNYTIDVVAPTATENGITTYTCNCGDSYTETIVPTDFTVTYSNYAMIGFTGETGENLVIPAVFEYAGIWYKVVSIDGSAFSGHTKLTSITIPNSVQSIGASAFYNCLGLTNITIPNSVTSIGNNAFKACRNLTSITIPNNLTSIGEGVFSGCRNLTSITIPNGVMSIGNYAFSGCSNLTRIKIPNSVTSIGESVFSDCSSLTTVYYDGTSTDWDKISIGSYGNTNLTNAIIYYYSETQPSTAGNYWHYVDGVPTKW